MRPGRLLVLALFLAVFVLPLAVLVGYAVDPGWRFPDLWPARARPDALMRLFGQRREILTALASSTLYSLLTVLACLAICLAPAKLLARREFPGKALVEGLLLAPALVPSMTFSMGVHHAFIRLGLADTMTGLVAVLTIFSFPYMLRALIVGYAAFGEEYAACARLLGAGPLTIALRVELPLLLPAITAGASVVFLAAFSEYFLVFLIGGGAVPSYSGYLFPFLTSSDRATGSLLTLLFLVVPMTLFLATDLLLRWRYRSRFHRF